MPILARLAGRENRATRATYKFIGHAFVSRTHAKNIYVQCNVEDTVDQPA